MLAKILDTVLNILFQVIGLKTLLQAIGIRIDETAVEHLPFQIESTVVATSLNVANPTYGLQASRTAQHAEYLDLVARITAINTAVTPTVTLPTTPPPGYGGLSASATGDAVWLYALPNATPFTALEAQDTMMSHFYLLGNNNIAYPVNGYPGYAMSGTDIEARASFAGPNQAFLDFSTIRATDATVFAWATRVYPTSPWVADIDNKVFERDSNNHSVLWYVDLNDLQFRQWKALTTGSVSRTPPVWPGLANVTLGTSVALADQQVVAGPLDGVIVHLTSVPATKTSYSFANTEHDWFRVGAIAFRTDNGQEEPPQLLGFDHAVYCPRSMQHAASALIRLQGAIVGTVQPWTMN